MIYINLKQNKSISRDFVILKKELHSNIEFLIKCTDSILELDINDSNFTKRNCIAVQDVKLDIDHLIENNKISNYNANKNYTILKDTILDIYFLNLFKLDKNLFKEVKVLTEEQSESLPEEIKTNEIKVEKKERTKNIKQ